MDYFELQGFILFHINKLWFSLHVRTNKVEGPDYYQKQLYNILNIGFEEVGFNSKFYKVEN